MLDSVQEWTNNNLHDNGSENYFPRYTPSEAGRMGYNGILFSILILSRKMSSQWFLLWFIEGLCFYVNSTILSDVGIAQNSPFQSVPLPSGPIPISFSLLLRQIAQADIMEVYFKELISKESSLDKLVDDLSRVVQGADDLAKSLGPKLAQRPDLALRVEKVREGCERINQEIVQGARATDKFVRSNPYYFIGGAVLLGLLIGAKLPSRK